MANRRMFSLKIIGSARFLKMPVDARELYFQLGMRADDDGIVEAYPILKQTGSAEDNLRILAAKDFIKILNEDLVSYILDWHEHNLIRSDRKIDSIYKGLLLRIIPEAELIDPKPRSDVKDNTRRVMGEQSVDSPRTVHGQHRLGKVRLGKVSGRESHDPPLTPSEEVMAFMQDPLPFLDDLLPPGMDRYVAEAELKKFVSYWTEPNKSGTKQRWQLEKTFELKRRLSTWFGNINNFKGVSTEQVRLPRVWQPPA